MGLSVDTFIDGLPLVSSRAITTNDVMQALSGVLKTFPSNRVADIRIHRKAGRSKITRRMIAIPSPPTWIKDINYKVWHDLYFYFPSKGNTGEFCIRRVDSLGNPCYEVLAGFHYFKTKQHLWPVQLDRALIELATRVVLPTGLSNTPQNPISEAWLSWVPLKFPLITGVRRLPSVQSKITPVSLGGVKKIDNAIWMFGYIKKKPPQDFYGKDKSGYFKIPGGFFAGDFFSFLLCTNQKNPISNIRSIDSIIFLKHPAVCRITMMEIFRTFFLEAMALQLMYGDVKQTGGHLEFFYSLARYSFLPVALIKNGYLHPVKGKRNTREAQKIVLEGLGLG